MSIKTDRNDARGIAQLMRMGWFRSVHAKSVVSRELRALLVARKQLLSRRMDLEASMRGILRGFGLKMGVVTRKGFEARVRELSAGQAMLSGSRARCWRRELLFGASSSNCIARCFGLCRDDEICRRLMSTPGVGPLVAITFKSAIDDRVRIAKSKTIGVLFGLVPKKYQSGERMLAAALLEPGTNRYAQRCMKRPM